MHIVAGWLQRDCASDPQLRQVPTKNFNQRPQHEISLVVLHGISLPPGKFGGPYVDQLFTLSLDPKVDPYFEGIYKQELSTHLFINRLVFRSRLACWTQLLSGAKRVQ